MLRHRTFSQEAPDLLDENNRVDYPISPSMRSRSASSSDQISPGVRTHPDGLGPWRQSWERLAPFVFPIFIGIMLRTYNLTPQILVDDEWHMVHRLSGNPTFMSVVNDFGANDHSVGLSAIIWMITRLTTANELILRLPSLLAGLALLFVFPLFTSRLLSRGNALVASYLVAISPTLCFFSRLARPYAVTTLLAFVAVCSCYVWLRTGSRRSAVLYTLTAAPVPIFHLPALPSVVAPALFALLLVASRRDQLAPTTRSLLAVFGVAFLLMAALISYPLVHSIVDLSGRLNTDRITLDTLRGAIELLIGTSYSAVVVAAVTLGLIGIVGIYISDWLLGCYLLTIISVQFLCVLGSRAAAIHTPVVAARYFGVVLPLLLILPAYGAQCIVRLRARATTCDCSARIGLALAVPLLGFGPLPWIYGAPNNFTNHISYQADYDRHRYFERFRPAAISSFYAYLSGSFPPNSIAVIEAPWYFYFHSYAYYQRIHEQRVIIGFVSMDPAVMRAGEVPYADVRVRLDNAVHVSDTDLVRATGARFLIVHRNPMTETHWPTGVADSAVNVAPLIETYTSFAGPPVFEDSAIVVFDLLRAPH